ncbi:MAG: N-acetyltransferase [Chloroflexi bacterium]|nr:N-acetyltransferase [Chloroflexota bacterium]
MTRPRVGIKTARSLKVEKACLANVPEIHRLINHFADAEEMLHRPLSEIYENLRDYFVVRQRDRVIACVALHICWADLAEIKSLAVAAEFQDQGIGLQMLEACLREAKVLGIPTIFCLTYKPDFFKRMGFQQVDKMELPRKVWGECYRCSKFPDCDEVALVLQIGNQGS